MGRPRQARQARQAIGRPRQAKGRLKLGQAIGRPRQAVGRPCRLQAGPGRL